MGTDRKLSMVVVAALLAVAACSDGGPPGPFHRPSMRDAPTTAADSGTPDDEEDAAQR